MQQTMQCNTSNLPTSIKLEKPKPYNGSVEDASILEAFLYACELYFQLVKHNGPMLPSKDGLVVAQAGCSCLVVNHKALASVRSSHLGSVVRAPRATISPSRCCTPSKGCMGIMHLRKRFSSKLC